MKNNNISEKAEELIYIKIDRSFVKDITSNPNDQVIVEAIIAMSRILGIRNIAECVETEEQLDFLLKQRCDEIQVIFYNIF
ncbi:MAG: EAL domain-containing protein [Spirochaetes bacterium]|nr:EAL domain-containing protein [Spirochaetota bacterium]